MWLMLLSDEFLKVRILFLQAHEQREAERPGGRAPGSPALPERHPHHQLRVLERRSDGSPAEPPVPASLRLLTGQSGAGGFNTETSTLILF